MAVASFGASQIMLTLLLGPGHATAGISAIAAWFTGAAVSYVLSRWAWERKGKPNLVKETLPFWAVSVGAAVVLTLTAKYANHEALRMGMRTVARVLFVDAGLPRGELRDVHRQIRDLPLRPLRGPRIRRQRPSACRQSLRTRPRLTGADPRR